MTRTGLFTIYASQETLEKIKEKIQNQVIICEILDKYIKIRLDEDVPAFLYLQNLIENENLLYYFHETRRYTKKELEAALFYNVYLSDPWELDGKSERHFNSDDNLLSGCPECGRGRVLKSDLYVQTSKLKKKDIVVLDPSIIISERVRDLIQKLRFTGCEFSTVRDYRTKEVVNYYRLNITSILPNMDPSVKIVKERHPCEVCHEYKQNLESEVIYQADQLGEIQDFNLTKEYFNMGIPVQKLIVSKRVRDAFRKEKIRVIYYEPIRIIG